MVSQMPVLVKLGSNQTDENLGCSDWIQHYLTRMQPLGTFLLHS